MELQLRCENELLAEKTEQQELQLKRLSKSVGLTRNRTRNLETQQRELEAKLRNSDEIQKH